MAHLSWARCLRKINASTEDVLLPKREEASVLDNSAALAEDAILGTSEDWDSLFGLDSREDTLDILDDDIFEEQVRCFKLHGSHGAKKMSLFSAVSETSAAAGSVLLHLPQRCTHSLQGAFTAPSG